MKFTRTFTKKMKAITVIALAQQDPEIQGHVGGSLS